LTDRSGNYIYHVPALKGQEKQEKQWERENQWAQEREWEQERPKLGRQWEKSIPYCERRLKHLKAPVQPSTNGGLREDIMKRESELFNVFRKYFEENSQVLKGWFRLPYHPWLAWKEGLHTIR